MGACNCICKKSETSAEIISEKKESASIIENPQEAANIHINPSIKEDPPISQNNSMETVQDKHQLVLPVQSLFRGYLSRLEYSEYTECISLPPVLPPAVFKPPIFFKVDFSSLPEGLPSSTASAKYSQCGDFAFGAPTGSAFQELQQLYDGNYYQGEVEEHGTPNGKGSMFFLDGSFYEGGWRNGKMHGVGRIITSTGDVCKGEFLEGRMTGEGEMEYSSGNRYKGGLVNDKPHGYGEEVTSDGTVYKGEYLDGLKNGRGRSTWPDGSYYEGSYFNDLYHGQGKYCWPDKEYDGEWMESKMHGKGTFKWSDGKMYSGEYVLGIKQGYGVFQWPDGKRYEGYWLDGKQHGEGTLFNKNRKKRGSWREGRYEKISGDEDKDSSAN